MGDGDNQLQRFKGFRWTKGDEDVPSLALLVDNTSKQLHFAEAKDFATNWGLASCTHPTLCIHSATTPGSDYLKIYHDGTNAYLDCIGGDEIQLQIAGTTYFSVNAGEWEIAAGTDIQFLGDADGILDKTGNEILQFTAATTAVNYLLLINAATANPLKLICMGTADRGFVFETSESEEMLSLGAVSAGVNYLHIINSITGNPVKMVCMGTADRGFMFETSESEEILELAASANAVNYLQVMSGSGSEAITLSVMGSADQAIMFENDQSEEMLSLVSVSDGINYLEIKNAATANPITLSNMGTVDKGFVFENAESEEILGLISGETAVSYLQVASGSTTVGITLSVMGEVDQDITFENSESEEMLVLNSGVTAVSYLKVTSGSSGVGVTLSVDGEAEQGISFENSESEELLTLSSQAAGVSHIDIKSGDTATFPTITATSTSLSDVDLVLAAKGTGDLDVTDVNLKLGNAKYLYSTSGNNQTYSIKVGSTTGVGLIDVIKVSSASELVLSQLGFFNATPAGQQTAVVNAITSSVGSYAVTAINAIKDRLVTLGLFAITT